MKLRGDFWWKSESPHNGVAQAVKWLDTHQGYHYARNRHNMRLYGSYAYYGLTSGVQTEASPVVDDRLRLNIVQSVIEAGHAQISTQYPKIMNLTDGGSWSQQQRAKKMDRWTTGKFYESNAYELGQMAFLNSEIFGTGLLKVVEKDNRASLDYVFTDDLLIDDRDGMYGKPRQTFHVMNVSRDALMAEYPKYKEEIEGAGDNMRLRERPQYLTIADEVSVCEAIHLPSKPGAKDGLHVICTDNCTLVRESWEHPYHPYADMRWGVRPLGFWGWGLADQLTGIQIEINYLLQKIQRLMTLATSQVWMQKGSNVAKQKLTNNDMAYYEYVGNAPLFMAVQSVSPEYFQHLDRLTNRAYEISGVNQLTAQAQKPPGLNSGVALAEFQDNQSRRFMSVSKRYDQMFVTLSNMLADKTREIHEREGSYSLNARGDGGLERLDWSDVVMDREDYVTQPYPTSFFPQTPAGKWQRVQEMISAGMLSKEQASELMEYPDLKAVTRLDNAPIEYVRRVVEQILEDGTMPDVDSFTPFDITKKLLPLEILRSEQDGVDEDRIDMLRQYLTETMRQEAELIELSKPPAPSPEMMGGMPPGMPPPGMLMPMPAPGPMVGPGMPPGGPMPAVLNGGM